MISIPRERKPGERRVGLSPAGVAELTGRGHAVVVEAGAGEGSHFADEEYSRAGARIVERDEAWHGELVVKVKEPVDDEAERLDPAQTLFTFLHLAGVEGLAERLAASGARAIAYELVGSSARGFPILAPMSEIAGQLGAHAAAQYLLATEKGGRGVLPGSVGGVKAARVVVIGGGISGSAAANAAAGAGADVVILERDLDQIRALGERFRGRARVRFSTEAYVEDEIADADAVIGCVLVPGREPPKVVSREHLALFRESAVLVDIAIDQGGCFATSKPTTHSQPIYREEGVIHYCVANMPAAVPRTATAALTHATLPYVLELADGVDEALDRSAELRAGLVVDSGVVSELAP